jgi:hypothetical protein
MKRARVKTKHVRVKMKHVRVKMKRARVEMKRARVEMKHARVETKRARVEMKHARVETKRARVKMKHAMVKMKHARVKTKHASLRTQRPANDCRPPVRSNPYNFGEILSSGPGCGDFSSKSGAALENVAANCSRIIVESLYADGVRGHQLPVTGSLSAVRFTRS